jgi:hypothetical protein
MPRGVVACLSVASFLGACAIPYKPPASGSTARIRIAAPEAARTAAVGVNYYEAGTCGAAMELGHLGVVLNSTDFRPIGIPGAEKLREGKFFERQISSGTRKMFSARVVVPWLYGTKTCYVSWSYIPAADADYEANIGWTASQCFVRTDRLVRDENNRLTASPEPSAKLEPRCSQGFY